MHSANYPKAPTSPETSPLYWQTTPLHPLQSREGFSEIVLYKTHEVEAGVARLLGAGGAVGRVLTVDSLTALGTGGSR